MRKNFWTKVFSVVLAVVLWLFVVSKGKSEIQMEVPVVYEHVPSGLQVLDDSDRTVEVGIWGHERFIGELSAGEVSVVVDLNDAGTGRKRLTLDIDDVRLPPPLKVVDIKPGYVDVHVETMEEKTVSVKALVAGEPREGFVVERVEVVPDSVTVEGPKSELRRISAIGVGPVDISRADKTVVARPEVKVSGSNVTPSVRSVEVRVIIVWEGG
jgi:YbbR domain-containing protein